MELAVNTVGGWPAPDFVCIGASALVDRAPLQFAERDPADHALASLLAVGAWGAPVLDRRGRYLGACTLRRFADLALPVSAADADAVQSLNFLREGANQACYTLGGRRRHACRTAARPGRTDDPRLAIPASGAVAADPALADSPGARRSRRARHRRPHAAAGARGHPRGERARRPPAGVNMQLWSGQGPAAHRAVRCVAVMAGLAAAPAHAAQSASLPGAALSLAWAIPFAGLLLSIALLPLFAQRFLAPP